MIEDFRLRVFVTVAREKSFTRAAEKLKITQPAVSQNVSELEKSYGVKLFDRLHGDIQLTPAGIAFKEYADQILSKYSELCKLLMPFPDTIVKVHASDEVFTYLTADLLGRFLAIHPEVRFEIVLLDEDADLKITLDPIKEERGMLALSYHPSAELASTRLYRVLSEFII